MSDSNRKARKRDASGQFMPTQRETRATADTRKPVAWQPPSRLDVPDPPAGIKWRWVRHELRGEDQSSNVYNRSRQGYVPVTPKELGNFPVDEMIGGKHAGVVRSGDLMLMKVDETVADSRNEYFEDRTKRLQQAVDFELDDNAGKEGKDYTGISRESSSSVTRGSPQHETDFED